MNTKSINPKAFKGLDLLEEMLEQAAALLLFL
jgi:hypothetical protein